MALFSSTAPPLPPPDAPPEDELPILDVDPDQELEGSRPAPTSLVVLDGETDQGAVERITSYPLSMPTPMVGNTAQRERMSLSSEGSETLTESLLGHSWVEEKNGPVFGRSSWLAVGGALVPEKDLVRVSNDDLQEAALRGDLGLVRRLIHAGASVNAPMRPEADEEFLTMLHILASKPGMPNGTRIIAEIILSRANLNARSTTGCTPLIFACEHRHLGAIEVLLDNNAQIHPVNDYGVTATSAVVLSGKDGQRQHDDIIVEVLHLLARAGANLDEGGDVPPITEAVKLLNNKAVHTLVELGATPTGLHEAFDVAPTDIIKTLIGAVANPFLKDRSGNTVMDLAFRRGDEDLKTLLRDFIGDLQRQQHPHCETQQHMSQIDDEDELATGMMLHLRSAKTQQRIMGHSSPVKEEWYHKHLRKAATVCRRVARLKVYSVGMFSNLIIALFLPDAWVIFNIANDTALDLLLLAILLTFIAEIIVASLGHTKSYAGSFFFWMDIIGCFSIPLDISIFIDVLPSGTGAGDAVVLRAARMAKLGTRAGRFTKLVKILRFLPGMGIEGDAPSGNTAKVISNTLNTALSIRVSGLIIVMVMIAPIFEVFAYPSSDYATRAWVYMLDDACAKFPDSIPTVLADWKSDFEEKDYGPYEARCFHSNGREHRYQLAEAPNRHRASITIEEDTTKGLYDFTAAYRVESICNVSMTITIVILMVGASLLLSTSVSTIVMTPLETLLSGVKRMAGHIFTSVANMAGKLAKDEGDDRSEEDMSNASNLCFSETELLEQVLRKLEKLSAITVKNGVDDTFAEMAESDRGVLADYAKGSAAPSRQISLDAAAQANQKPHCDKTAAELSGRIDRSLEETSLSWAQLEKWDFDVLGMSEKQRQATMLSLFQYERGQEVVGDPKLPGIYSKFLEAVRTGYGAPRSVPYHNWNHAVDVGWMLHRTMILVAAEHFISQHERFALEVSAICHDIGHPGLNNVFLVETTHDLAIMYNDQSPLEMMHTARMWELARQPDQEIFADFSDDQRREIRSVSCEAILHTDYKHHFQIVKDLANIKDSNAEAFDVAHTMYLINEVDYPTQENIEVFSLPEAKTTIRNMLLHFCDVSNPTKPFNLCQVWAYMITDEFFNQGDREKELGIVVQPLNDREKVNKHQSQVGFIEFFVAPFVINIEKLVFPMEVLANQLFKNLDHWFNLWVESAHVPDDEQAKVLERLTKLVRKRNGKES
jgi:ankyrin repeat protein